MKTTDMNAELIAQLQAENARLMQENQELKNGHKAMEDKIASLHDRISYLTRQIYGRSSEKLKFDSNQLTLEQQVEFLAPILEDLERIAAEQQTVTIGAHERKVSKPRKLDPDAFEQVDHVYDLSEEEKVCSCGCQMHVMNADHRRREIVHIREKYETHNYITPLYSCRNCDKNADAVKIKKAEAPNALIPKSYASSSFVANILYKKFYLAQPLDRQERALGMSSVWLNKQTMCDWIFYCTEKYLVPVYEKLKSCLLEQEILHADETTINVLSEKDRKDCYMWLFRTVEDSKRPATIYKYSIDRSIATPEDFLSGWNGYLHVDGYSVYKNLKGVKTVGCWAHARRKFTDALKNIPKDKQKNSNEEAALAYIRALFRWEENLKKKSLQGVALQKAKLSDMKKISDEFFGWVNSKMNEPSYRPTSMFAKACQYAANQRESLERYFDDPRLTLSNNLAERTVKPFVIGRKNWLFAVSILGAQTNANVYSIIQTAIDNGLNPEKYLELIFNTLKEGVTDESIEMLLPWNQLAQETCKAPERKSRNNLYQSP